MWPGLFSRVGDFSGPTLKLFFKKMPKLVCLSFTHKKLTGNQLNCIFVILEN